MSDSMAIRFPTRRLKRVDLPTFALPMIATSGFIFSSYVFFSDLLLFLCMPHSLPFSRRFSRVVLSAFIISLLVMPSFVGVAGAADTPTTKSPIPSPQEVVGGTEDCGSFMQGLDKSDVVGAGNADNMTKAQFCGIRTGHIPLWLIPFYIVKAVDFLLLMSGLISVLFIIIGGYRWIIMTYADEKDSGKKTITHAIIGLVVSLLSYLITNLVLYLLSS